MNWEVISQYLPLYQKAMWLTLRIGWMGIAFSIIIGLICALIVHYKIPVARQIVKIYIELFRNTPLLVQLFFIYFGLPKVGLSISADVCGVAVEPIQMESALSLGMTKKQAVLYVILPQAVSISVPAFVANVIFLLKETSVFSAISLMDLMFTAKDLIGLYYKTAECLFLLVVFYLIILLPVSILGTLLERRLRYAGFGN